MSLAPYISPVFWDQSYKVNDEGTLGPYHLSVIYHAMREPREGDGAPWTEVHIKQIIGDMLKLAEQPYNRLDLKGVMEVLRSQKWPVTKSIAHSAEENKQELKTWIKQKFDWVVHVRLLEVEGVEKKKLPVDRMPSIETVMKLAPESSKK